MRLSAEGRGCGGGFEGEALWLAGRVDRFKLGAHSVILDAPAPGGSLGPWWLQCFRASVCLALGAATLLVSQAHRPNLCSWNCLSSESSQSKRLARRASPVCTHSSELGVGTTRQGSLKKQVSTAPEWLPAPGAPTTPHQQTVLAKSVEATKCVKSLHRPPPPGPVPCGLPLLFVAIKDGKGLARCYLDRASQFANCDWTLRIPLANLPFLQRYRGPLKIVKGVLQKQIEIIAKRSFFVQPPSIY